MANTSQLKAVKQIFKGTLSSTDKRAKIQLLDFVTALIFSFTGDSKSFSLEGLRRKMIGYLDQNIPSSSFWDRLATKSLTNNLQNIIGHLMGSLELPAHLGKTFLKALGVNSVQLIDSSSISLWDNLKKPLPGTRTTAGVKWHACFDLLTGMLTWFDLSSTSSSDRKHFPNVEDLKGVLIIFDLGYFDYALMKMIDNAKGFYLSRVKTSSSIMVLLPILGIGKKRIGTLIKDIKVGSKVIDFMGLVNCKEFGQQELRVVGFWNPETKIYHWYVTNLSVDAAMIYPLYRLRWQIELIFKSCKSSLSINEIPTGNPNIVMNLLLSSIIAYIVSLTIIDIAKNKLLPKEVDAITAQRITKVYFHLSFDLIKYFLQNSKLNLVKLKDKIMLFARELFDPNFKKRPTSYQEALRLC